MYKNVKESTIIVLLWTCMLFLLCSCGNKSIAVKNATEATKENIEALERSLPENCATDGIKTQIKAIKLQVESLRAACEAEKTAAVAAERDKKRRWQLGFLSLLSLVLGFAFFKRVAKA